MYGLMMSAREFSSDELEEDMVALKLRTAPDRNRSKQKHDKNTIYRPRAIRGLYRQKLNNETKAEEEIGTETSSEANTPQGGAASRGPAPPGGVDPPGSVSNSFSSRDFSYLIKTTKVLTEKFNTNLF
jgi:hypothetical protein